MSVRRSSLKAASRGNRGAWGLIRSFFFWVFLLVASFAVGALIIAPLYNAYTGSRSEQGAPATASAENPTPLPPPAPQSAVTPPPVQERRPELPANTEPDIQITPDEPETSVQPAESPDESRPRRRSRDVPRVEPPTVEQSNEPSPDSRSVQPEDTVAREEPAPEPERRVTRRERRNGENTASESKRERSSRPRRRASEERSSSPRTTTPPSGDIQTPEKIDP